MQLSARFILASLTAVVFGFAACDSAAPDDSGRITVLIKDEPFPFDLVDSVMVTINSVELVGEDTTDNVLVLSDIEQSFNLLELRDGVTDTLAALPIPEGNYSGLRVVVDESAYVVLKDGTRFDLKTPSATTSGLKIQMPPVEVSDFSDEVEVLVDFDVEKSFVLQGNAATPAGIKGFLFKPVIKVESLELNDVELVTE
ncbi:MAG: DUF4382 domain-containing protein [Rhodothermia bacterium]|nr:DUF4382 domain-containing protein [Rhodothermia bacterium]NNE35654.1 DUF4382 domain-containing protein [Rhodothermales bacterium]